MRSALAEPVLPGPVLPGLCLDGSYRLLARPSHRLKGIAALNGGLIRPGRISR